MRLARYFDGKEYLRIDRANDQAVTPTPLDSYKLLRGTFGKDIKSATNRGLLGDSFRASLAFLLVLEREPLISAVAGKRHFAFSDGKKFSRAVNADLFVDDIAEWDAFESAMKKKKKSLKGFDADRLTRLIYSVAISFCCYIDRTHSGDQKTPGTFFEYLIAHLFAWRLNVNPERSIQVLNLDMKTSLPTDFIFNLGPERPKFHLPVKLNRVFPPLHVKPFGEFFFEADALSV